MHAPAQRAGRDGAAVLAAQVLGQQGHRPAGGVVTQAQRVATELTDDAGIGDAAGDTRPPSSGRVAEAVGLVRPQVEAEPAVHGAGLGAGDPSGFRDGKAASQQQDRLHAPKEAEVSRPRQGAGESLRVVLVETEFMGSSCSSHRSSLLRRAISWKTFGYLLRGIVHVTVSEDDGGIHWSPGGPALSGLAAPRRRGSRARARLQPTRNTRPAPGGPAPGAGAEVRPAVP